MAPEQLVARAELLASEGKRVALLSHERPALKHDSIVQVALPADSQALAHDLYASLRYVDRLGCDVAVIALPAEQGIGSAIADRLRRAAGPREPG